MLQEVHANEDSFLKEDSVLEQCEQLSTRLREALQAHEEDRYDVQSPHALCFVLTSCFCVCAPIVCHLCFNTLFSVCSMNTKLHERMESHAVRDPA